MAKLEVLPSQAIIDGFKGKIDYYVYMDVPCARKWPRSPGHRRSPAVEAQWPIFAKAAHLWSTLSPEIQSLYNSMAHTAGQSGRDVFSISYISGIYDYPHED